MPWLNAGRSRRRREADDVANLIGRQDTVCQSKDLMFNRGVAHWLFDAADRVLNKCHKPLCILQRDRYSSS
jgi:hypothetical protein